MNETSPLKHSRSWKKQFLRSNTTPQMNMSDFILRQIGKGSFGVVYQAVHKGTLQKYALKQIYKPGHELTIHHELTVMYTLNHVHIVRLFDHFQDEMNIYLVLEMVDGKQLFEGVLKNKQHLPHAEVARLIHQLCLALEYIHSLNIIHRDIKPENIMLTSSGVLKLTDFGAANFIKQDECRKTFIGTPQYIAPEIIEQREQGFATDIWSVGVLLFELVTLKLPFDASSPALIYQNVKKAKYDFPVILAKEKELKHLISNMIVIEPAKRLTIKDILKHPWMLKYTGNANPVSEIVVEDETAKLMEQRLKELKKELAAKEEAQVESPEQERQILELQRKTIVLTNKIETANTMLNKKKELLQTNNEKLQEMQKVADQLKKLKQDSEQLRSQIDIGNNDYLAALELRKRLKHQELTLEYEINTYKNSIIRKKKSQLRNEQPEDQNVGTVREVEDEPLRKALSFSVSQIENFLEEIKKRKQKIRNAQASPCVL